MWLIAGLGNPGKDYQNNRHNIGFMAVEQIASDYAFPSFKTKYSSLIAEGRMPIGVAQEKALLIMPQTYMNHSGRGIGEAANFYKIPTSRIVVFHDELDLAPGKVRIKKGGGAAGHNGLRSMDDWLPDSNYWRVRIGIGHPGDKAAVSNYVLGNFAKSDKDWIDPLVQAMSKHLGLLLQEQDELYMTKVAMETKPPKPKKPIPEKDTDNGI